MRMGAILCGVLLAACGCAMGQTTQPTTQPSNTISQDTMSEAMAKLNARIAQRNAEARNRPAAPPKLKTMLDIYRAIPAKYRASARGQMTWLAIKERNEWVDANIVGWQLEFDGKVGTVSPVKEEQILVSALDRLSIGSETQLTFECQAYLNAASYENLLTTVRPGDLVKISGTVAKVEAKWDRMERMTVVLTDCRFALATERKRPGGAQGLRP